MKLLLAFLLCIAGLAHAQTFLNPPAGRLMAVTCGAPKELSYVTGFDEGGNVKGAWHEQVTCGLSGKQHQTVTYNAYRSLVWDRSGAVVTVLAWDGTIADKNFAAVDATGAQISNLTNPSGVVYRGLLLLP